MQNVEINVKVNGKEVPLSTISTETFEKVKAAEREKNIPAVRVASYVGAGLIEPRLFLKMPDNIKQHLNETLIVIDFETGHIVNWHQKINGLDSDRYYSNIRPLEELL